MSRSYPVGGFFILLALFLVACSNSSTAQIEDLADSSAPASTTVKETKEQEMTPTPSEQESQDAPSEAESRSYAGTVPAPEFPRGLDWLNIEGELSLDDLRGKVILLDFWTYGCVNCLHIIPDLKQLERKYADELVVVGVHSAKFENEGETENIRRIIQRYELEHPVVNDNEFQIWSQYGARAWPTLVLIDPDGNVLGSHSGEGIYEPFDFVIGAMIEEFDAQGRIDRTPLELRLEQESQRNSPLLFPGKVLADESGNRLFIADSNHNRIVITDLEGVVLEVVGDGRPRLKDGDFETASFFRPQGLTLADEHTLYIADTENHTIRRIDLENRLVETVAGNGEQVYSLNPLGPAILTPLNSPWDVLWHDGIVYIAMAGQHQLWAYEPSTETIRLHAGSGREELRDGPLETGGLNQPSGLATDGQLLFIADSEASAIRTADLQAGGQLDTIVGTGLFDFGDVDGSGDEVRLQHPLGVAFHDGTLYIADTYNSKIKKIDPEKRQSSSFLGSTESGWRDGDEALFDEPGGLSVIGDKLYIADTNNHVIRVADLATRAVSTLVLVDLEGLLVRQPPGEEYNGLLVKLDSQTIMPGKRDVRLEIIIPDGYKPNDLAPFSMDWQSSDDSVLFEPSEANLRIVEPEFPLTFEADFRPGEGELTGDLVIYYCEAEAQSLCSIERVRITAPFLVAAEGQDELVLLHEIELPEFPDS